MELGIRLRSSRAFATRADDVAVEELGRRLVTNLERDRLNATQLERYGTLGLCDLPGFVSRLRVRADQLTIIVNGTFILEKHAGVLAVPDLGDGLRRAVELLIGVPCARLDAQSWTRISVYLLNVWCFDG